MSINPAEVKWDDKPQIDPEKVQWDTPTDAATSAPSVSEKSLPEKLGRAAGLTARAGLQALTLPVTGLADIGAGAINSATGSNIPSASAQFSKGLTELGLPERETQAEKTVGDVTDFAGSLLTAPEQIGRAASAVPKVATDLFGRAKTLGGNALDTIMGRNVTKATGEAANAAGEAANGANVLRSSHVSELEAAKADKTKEAERLKHEAEIAATSARVTGENRASVLGKVKAKQNEADAAIAKIDNDMRIERDEFKNKWEPEVTAKERAGNSFMTTPEYDNVISLIDRKIKDLKSVTARSTLRAIKSKIESAGNFAGLDIERQDIGSRAYKEATSQGLQEEVKDIHRALTDAMGRYSTGYGEMLKKWGEAKGQKEILEGAKKQFEEAAKKQTGRTESMQKEAASLKEKVGGAGKSETAKISEYHNSIQDLNNTNDHKQIASKAEAISKKLLDDKLIDDAKYAVMRHQIEQTRQLFDKQIAAEKNAEAAKKLTHQYRMLIAKALGVGGAVVAEETIRRGLK